MKNIFGLLFILLLTSNFIACSGGDDRVVGTWESIEYYLAGELSDISATVIFKKDGSASFKPMLGEGTYTVEGSTITFTTESDIELVFKFQDDETLISESSIVKIIYKKK